MRGPACRAEPGPRRGSKAARGFTLVEVLVALLVMALLAAMSWQGVDGIVRVRDASQSRLERTLRLNTTMAQWEHDLGALQESAAVPAISFDGATLRVTRRTEAGLQVVAWALRPGGAWTRWAGPVVAHEAALQESWLRSQQLLGNEVDQLLMFDGVVQWQLYFFRGTAWSNAQSSGGQAASPGGAVAAPRQLLPTGVRLVLGFEPRPNGEPVVLTRDVALGPAWP